MSAKLDKQSTRWIWLSVGTATSASLAASYIVCKAMKTLRRQVVEDVIAARRTMDVDRWRRAAADAEPHLKAVHRS